MAIDPSIALQLRPFQMEPRTNALARIVGLQGQMRQNALGELQAQEVAAGLQEKESLRKHLAGAPNLDTPEGQAALYGVAPTQAGGILKGRLDLKKGEVDIANVAGKTARDAVSADADRWKIAHEKAQKGLELIAGAKDQASYDAARAQGQAMGLTFSGPERFDPAFVENAKNQALSVVQRLEQDWKAKGYQLDVSKHGETVRHNKAAEGTAQGQLGVAQGQLGLSRQRLAFDQSQPKGQYDSERGLMIDPRTAQAQPVTMGGQPLGPKDKPLAEGAQKQVLGARNTQDAVTNYLEKLDGWSKGKMVSPDARAEMGNAYNNMMLQAKEAYNLGVLNGPDYAILQSVVKDPTKVGSAIVSNVALAEQGKELRRIAQGIEKNVLEAHGKTYTPRPNSGGKGAPGEAVKVTNDADYNALPKGTPFVTPDGRKGVKS